MSSLTEGLVDRSLTNHGTTVVETATVSRAVTRGPSPGSVGLAMLRRYRHPLLTHERYHSRRAVTEALHIRRLLSAGLTLLLGLLSPEKMAHGGARRDLH